MRLLQNLHGNQRAASSLREVMASRPLTAEVLQEAHMLIEFFYLSALKRAAETRITLAEHLNRNWSPEWVQQVADPTARSTNWRL